jgi:hypothetical protein
LPTAFPGDAENRRTAFVSQAPRVDQISSETVSVRRSAAQANVRARGREEGDMRSFNGDHDRSAYALNIASVASSKVFSRNFLHRDPISAGCSLGCLLLLPKQCS